MGTRSGDLDPSIRRFLADHEGLTPKAVDELLNKESGLLGLCGDNDMRQVIQKMEAGDRRSEIALAVYTYRIKHYIRAYVACLGRVDALVFTAGIGENARWFASAPARVCRLSASRSTAKETGNARTRDGKSVRLTVE